MQGAVPVPHSPVTASLEDDVVRVLRDDGIARPRRRSEAGPAEVVALYARWSASRALDERLVALQRQGRIAFHIGSLGEEAAIVGRRAALRDERLDLPLLPRVRRRALARDAARSAT